MSLRELSASEVAITLQCLQFVLKSRYFDDMELPTRLGVSRLELGDVLSRWPDLADDVRDHRDFFAVNNAFNEVCNGIALSPGEWQEWFSVSRDEICKTYARWLQSLQNS